MVTPTTPVPGTNPPGTLGTPPTPPNPPTPPTPAAPTREERVAKAVDELSKTALGTLWKENVTDAAWYMKLIGLITYLWYRSEAAAADEKFGATIDQFNEATTKLVQAVAKRRFSQQEADELGLPPVQFANSGSQLAYAQLNLDVEEKLKVFYDLFKKRVEQLNCPEDLGVYAAAAQKIIQDLSQSKDALPEIEFPATLSKRIETTLHDFNGKIFNDMVAAYADQPLAQISIENFTKTARDVKGFFPEIDNVDIETRMRQAITDKYSSDAIEAIRAEYTNEAANAPRFVAFRKNIETKLKAEKTKLEADFNALRGSNGQNGTVDAAYRAMQTAKAPMDQAKAVYMTQRNGFGNAARPDISVADLIDLEVTDSRLAETKADLVAKHKIFEEKQKAYVDLDAKLKKIARFAEGASIPNAGQLVETNEKLANLDREARSATTKVANFLNELKQVVGNDKVARSQALHAIIDPPRAP